MKIKPENKQADTQQERYGSSKDLLSSLCLDRNQPLWARSHHCATGLTLREGRFMAKHLFLWRNQDFSSVNWVFHPWADNTAHEQTSALLSLPCPYSITTTQNTTSKECQLQEATITHLWGWGKEGERQEEHMRTGLEYVSTWDNGWLSPFQ